MTKVSWFETLGRNKMISRLNLQTGREDHLATYSMVNGLSLPRGVAAGVLD